MNIDFHHAVTFIVARCAGFNAADSEVIAHAAQYVDDAINDGYVYFENGATYSRCTTAHRMLDYKNFAALASQRVWIPFHFLPGGAEGGGKFIDKLVCRPNSAVASHMMRACIDDAERPYALHRLGISAHVFVDTWAHQGFAGVNHTINQVRAVYRDGKVDTKFQEKLSRFFGGLIQQRVPPIGHGAALAYPDRPFLRWSYINGRGDEIIRDNPRDFTEAADELCKSFRRFRMRDGTADVEGLPRAVRARIFDLLETTTEASELKRHARWLQAIKSDEFGIGSADIAYEDKGFGSWKHFALGTTERNDATNRAFPFTSQFLGSDWKRFHDAAKAHRRSVVDDILPEFEILVA